MEVEQLYQPNGETSVDLSNNTDISQLCRICGNASEYLIPIFEGEGLENELEMKIKKHLPIQVSREDEMPINLCYQCASTLIAWHDLTLGCIQADKKLQHLVRSCFKEESSAQDKIEEGDGVDSIEEMSDIEIEFEEEEEVTTNPSTSSQVNFLSRTSNTNEVPVVLQVAEEKNQAKEVERNENSAVETTSSERCLNTKIHKAQIFNKRSEVPDFNNIYGKQDHLSKNAFISNISNIIKKNKKSSVEEKIVVIYPCKYCDEKFTFLSKYQNHMTGHKRSSMNGDCSKSEDIFGEIELDSNDEIRKYLCQECGKTIEGDEMYSIHQRRHRKEKQFVCHICNKAFIQCISLSSHLRYVHLGIKDYVCEVCGRAFAGKFQLENHKISHTEERPYICHICGKSYKNRNAFNSHFKVHTNDHPYECQHCYKKFQLESRMINHVAIHTNKKKLECEVCQKCFATKRNFNRHRKLHEVVGTPFECPLCTHSSVQKQYIRRHVKVQHQMLYEEAVEYAKEAMNKNETIQVENATTKTDKKTITNYIEPIEQNEIDEAVKNVIVIQNEGPEIYF